MTNVFIGIFIGIIIGSYLAGISIGTQAICGLSGGNGPATEREHYEKNGCTKIGDGVACKGKDGEGENGGKGGHVFINGVDVTP